jgi:ATP synthase protein I
LTPSDPTPRHPAADPEADRRRIDEIQAQLKKARGTVEKPRESSAVSHRQTAVAYRVLVDMIAGLLVGGFLGYWLDRWLGWTPWSLVTGLIVGFAAGVNNAWRAIRAYSKDAAGGDEGNRRLP